MVQRIRKEKIYLYPTWSFWNKFPVDYFVHHACSVSTYLIMPPWEVHGLHSNIDVGTGSVGSG